MGCAQNGTGAKHGTPKTEPVTPLNNVAHDGTGEGSGYRWPGACYGMVTRGVPALCLVGKHSLKTIFAYLPCVEKVPGNAARYLQL